MEFTFAIFPSMTLPFRILGKSLALFESAGLRIRGIKFAQVEPSLLGLEGNYLGQMMTGSSLVVVLTGEKAVKRARECIPQGLVEYDNVAGESLTMEVILGKNRTQAARAIARTFQRSELYHVDWPKEGREIEKFWANKTGARKAKVSVAKKTTRKRSA